MPLFPPPYDTSKLTRCFWSQKNEKSHGISERVYDVHEGGEKKVKGTTKDDQSVSL